MGRSTAGTKTRGVGTSNHKRWRPDVEKTLLERAERHCQQGFTEFREKVSPGGRQSLKCPDVNSLKRNILAPQRNGKFKKQSGDLIATPRVLKKNRLARRLTRTEKGQCIGECWRVCTWIFWRAKNSELSSQIGVEKMSWNRFYLNLGESRWRRRLYLFYTKTEQRNNSVNWSSSPFGPQHQDYAPPRGKFNPKRESPAAGVSLPGIFPGQQPSTCSLNVYADY